MRSLYLRTAEGPRRSHHLADRLAVTPVADSKDRCHRRTGGRHRERVVRVYSLDRHPSVPFDKLLDRWPCPSEPDTRSAGSGSHSLAKPVGPGPTGGGVRDRGHHPQGTNAIPTLHAARQATGQDNPPEKAVAKVELELLNAAANPFAANPELRHRLTEYTAPAAHRHPRIVVLAMLLRGRDALTRPS